MSFVAIGLSFLEGLALIASPCILPILPLILGASVESGRKRPFGIIVGFVLAFTGFALLSRKLVMALHLDLDIIKYGSLAFLALFGLVLLSEKLSAQFSLLTQRFANTGGALTAKAKEGFLSGILIGCLIGFIWTPCAGPILASVLVQVIREESDISAILEIAAFALGAGLPMLIIALTGRKLMSRLGFFTTHAEGIRKGFGLIILLAVGVIASGFNVQAVFDHKQTTSIPQSAALIDGLAQPYPAPEFTGIDGWLNAQQPLTLASLHGKVVLVDFWTYSCINCLRTLPYLTAWDRQYRDKGLVIIGVHAPEFAFERDKNNVAAALTAHGIAYPVALDNRLDTWTAFHNQYWPAHYLINQQGQVVYTHFGEGHYAETENNIRYLLGLERKFEEKNEVSATSQGQTPETYLGYKRSARFASPEVLARDVPQTYTTPSALSVHSWALAGAWRVEGERIVATQAGASLKIKFNAEKVYLVLGTKNDRPVKASVLLNGRPLGTSAGKDTPDSRIDVRAHRLYELVAQREMREGVLEIKSEESGLTAYAFTFGR